MSKDTVAPGTLTLRVITPDGIALEAVCDSVTLPLSNGVNGEGGGAVGIRRGHIKAIMALSTGVVRASMGGAAIAAAHIGGGLAKVENDMVDVITSSVTIESL